ncbi:primase [Vibrio phage 1.188.A._10N.286.51.A6]|uniref:Primase n=3 Tax=Mukerjeevirus mv51A6 TaxID=2734162 RepID=A0A2I7RIZ7_9CAUD|nr:DNA primase [Vibrio phage 1.188.A._10N.286.51.A6]AUR93628.1 primase [Vibrio phage 1.188.A._10N.286.51.A6]AUR93714.1 primase [Vibrio phage 1.188.B._10N.286.51.A6]AUR93800.1 primase [Vibrio phage 1.188.C._10N.286.51.A6]
MKLPTKLHPLVEQVCHGLSHKCNNPDLNFFRVSMTYYLGRVAAMMHMKVKTEFTDPQPLGIYAMNLAPSGYGKNHSKNLINNHVIKEFNTRFFNDVFYPSEEDGLEDMANMIHLTQPSRDLDDIRSALTTYYRSLGGYSPNFSYDSTVAGIRQMRDAAGIVGVGSLNLELDEVGANLVKASDILDIFLELYDAGLLSNKVLKNTGENARISLPMDLISPACALMFGTPDRLLDGRNTEKILLERLVEGFGRRCIFGFGDETLRTEQDSAVLYDKLTNPSSHASFKKMSGMLAKLADASWKDANIEMPKDQALRYLDYQIHCNNLGEKMKKKTLNTILLTEVTHRPSKVLRVAALYAMLDSRKTMTTEDIDYAIALVELSGKALHRISTQDKPHVRLAKFLLKFKHREFNDVDLIEELTYYPSSPSQQNQMMDYAKTWGLKHNVVITTKYENGIAIHSAKAFEKTDTDKLTISYNLSGKRGDGYKNVRMPFSKLAELVLRPNGRYTNHHLQGGMRNDAAVIKGFNVLVIDMDDGTPIKYLKSVLEDYTYILHITKRHTSQHNRCRILIPMTHNVEVDDEVFKETLASIRDFFPFEMDASTIDRCRMWSSEPKGKKVITNAGKLFEILPHIPRTHKNQEMREQITELTAMQLDGLQRWVVIHADKLGRNNTLLRYAKALTDAGFNSHTITSHVSAMNKRLPSPLSQQELQQTIFKTIKKKASV